MSLEQEIQTLALELGFDLVGFASAELLAQEKESIQAWVSQRLHGNMSWYEKSLHIRLDLENLGFRPKSVIVLGLVYLTEQGNEFVNISEYKISQYALGKDYHKVLKAKAKPLLKFLRESFPKNYFRQGVDSLPVAEKVYGKRAGIGWIGKNTNLISPEKGSYFFLSVILTDLELKETGEISDRCGTCRKCLDACPTGALFEEYKIDACKCISYLTIEERAEKLEIPFQNWIYGCDICQMVCPWNEKAIRWKRFSQTLEFEINPKFLDYKDKFNMLSEKEWSELRKESAMERISYQQWKRNLDWVKIS
ncbi:MAG: tRNA epoxyqueuosine(34) reductase QueG [Leptospiraceae bacterium]|nr:tRNA epoxyqueuosine(34) reductase QueG [Leptospiraceae bacterium]